MWDKTQTLERNNRISLHKELFYNGIVEHWMGIEFELNRELPNDSHPSSHA